MKKCFWCFLNNTFQNNIFSLFLESVLLMSRDYVLPNYVLFKKYPGSDIKKNVKMSKTKKMKNKKIIETNLRVKINK